MFYMIITKINIMINITILTIVSNFCVKNNCLQIVSA